MDKIIYMCMALILSLIEITGCSTTHQTAIPDAAKKPVETISLQGDSTTVWLKLQHLSLTKLRANLAETTASTTDNAWIKLAIINKEYGPNTTDLLNQLMAWRKEYPNHPANSLFPDNAKLTHLAARKTQKHVALLLPLQGRLGPQGQAVRDGYLSAYYDSLTKNNPQQTISFFDTSNDANLSALYQKAIAQGADVIVGPLSKQQVQQLSTKTHHPVTTLALNYTDQSSSDPNLFQFGLSQKDEAEQLADKALQSGKSRAIMIASKEAWSQHIVKALTERWESQGGKIVDTYYYLGRTNFAKDIAKLRRQDFDTLFLVTLPQQGREIVPLLKYYYTDNIPIYSTSVIYTGSPSPQKDADLNGVIFCDIPWVLNKPSKSQHNRLYAVGRDAELLSNELERLTILPHFPLQAATGLLTLNSKQQIYRQVPWTQMHAGHP